MMRIKLVWLCLALAVFAAPALAGDMILQEKGKWFPNPPEGGGEPGTEDLNKSPITVLQEDYDKTYYKFENVSGRQSMDTSKIVRVLYQVRPERFVQGAAAMGANRLPEAIQLFDDVAKNKRNVAWARMYSLYNIGRIYQEGLMDWKSAISAWDRLQAEFKKSKFLPKAIVAKGLAYLQLEQEDQARQAFQSLERLPGLPEGKKKIAKYYLIKITQIKGEKAGNATMIQQALGQYQALLKEVEGNDGLTEVAILARLGIGDCLLKMGKFGEALDFFKKIAASSDDPDVLAGAFNGLGKCHFEKREWKEALFSFLRVVVLYNENQEQTAFALYHAAQSYNLAKGADFKERTKALYRECIAKYGNTEWGRKSKEALPGVR